MRDARSYIVRIYGRLPGGSLDGVVEPVGAGRRVSFRTAGELWAIVSRRVPRRLPSRRRCDKPQNPKPQDSN
jgi:hypothetical protein